MRTIIEEPSESLLPVTPRVPKEFNDVETPRLLSHRPTMYKDPINGIDSDIINFIEDLHRQHQVKQKSNKGNIIKNHFNKDKTINELNDKSKKPNLGLTDNFAVDSENKQKAQKGLLMLLNKMSNGQFVPEINNYIKKKNEEIKRNTQEEKVDEELVRSERKKLTKGTIKNEMINLIPSNNEDTTNDHHLSNDSKVKPITFNDERLKNCNKAGMYNRSKYFKEDQGMEDYDVLIYYFSKSEVNDYRDLKKSINEDEGFRIKLNRVGVEHTKRKKIK